MGNASINIYIYVYVRFTRQLEGKIVTLVTNSV